MRAFAEEVRDEFENTGNVGGTTDQDNLVEVGVVDPRGMRTFSAVALGSFGQLWARTTVGF